MPLLGDRFAGTLRTASLYYQEKTLLVSTSRTAHPRGKYPALPYNTTVVVTCRHAILLEEKIAS
jgi:hypothetical protein